MRSHRKAFCLLLSVCFMAATATAAFAQAGATTGKCSFQQLNFPPPATNGQAVALNDLGGIAGSFLDSKNEGHGFLLYQGKLTTFKFPGSVSTSVSDMSRNGIIVGGYFNADGKGHAFMVHAGGFRNITITNCVFEYCHGLALEEELQRGLLGSPNQMEAVLANFEKREPKFSDP